AREWQSIDPGHAIAAAIPGERVLGCVVHLACAVERPGVVRHVQGRRLIVGEARGGDSERARRVASLLADAGFETEVSPRIQQDVWFKLWGNMTMNPVSAITGATLDRILDDPLVRGFVSAAMLEASAIGERIGLPIPISPEERHQVTRQLGAFKTSMLQDVEAGRPVELDALVAIVTEIGRALGVPTPNVDALFSLARMHARMRGLYPGGTDREARLRDAGDGVREAAPRGIRRTSVRVRGAGRHRRSGAPARRRRTRGGEDPGDAGRRRQAADRADARRPQGVDEEPGAAGRPQEHRALRARSRAAPFGLPGRRHVAVRDAQGDAGLRRGVGAGAAEDLDQRRSTRLPGVDRAARARRSAARGAGTLRARGGVMRR